MGTDAIEVNRRVGRLIETRIKAMLSLDDVVELRKRYMAIHAASSDTFLSAIDLRTAVTRGRSQIAEQLLQLFRDTNPRIERTAILVGGDALLPVQVEALILNAHHPGRRMFREIPPFLEFLGEGATSQERARLVEFLNELDPLSLQGRG